MGGTKEHFSIDEYSRLIQERFPYLFKEYGFRISYSKEYRLGYGWFRIGLESKKCRILFAREQGGGIMFLGAADAPFNNEDDTRWVPMLNLLAYLLNKQWDWRFLDGLPQDERVTTWLAFNAKELEPMCEQVIEMFRSTEVVAEWKPKYDEFIQKSN
jgi:hypothetical protein